MANLAAIALIVGSTLPQAALFSTDVESSKRIFCESDPGHLPYIKFNFYPYDSATEAIEGDAVVSVDHGVVLDISTYHRVVPEISEEQISVPYRSGHLLFDITGDFEHKGSIKHFTSSDVIKKQVTCYFIADL